MVISIEKQRAGYLPGIFRALELHSFSNGKIVGIDSHIHLPCPIEIKVGEVVAGDLTFDAPRAGLQPSRTCFNTRKSMNENIYTSVILIIALIVIFTVVFLIPQALGLGVYRLLKPRVGLFAALAGFFLPLILYCAVFGYFWYFAAPTPAEELPSGEGDLVGPAIALFGFIANVGGGLILYAYLLAKNLRRPPEKIKSGAKSLP